MLKGDFSWHIGMLRGGEHSQFDSRPTLLALTLRSVLRMAVLAPVQGIRLSRLSAKYLANIWLL